MIYSYSRSIQCLKKHPKKSQCRPHGTTEDHQSLWQTALVFLHSWLKVHWLRLLLSCVRDKCAVGWLQCKWPFSQPRRLSLLATHSHLLPLLFSQADCFLLARSLQSVLAHTLSQHYISSNSSGDFIFVYIYIQYIYKTKHIYSLPPPL